MLLTFVHRKWHRHENPSFPKRRHDQRIDSDHRSQSSFYIKLGWMEVDYYRSAKYCRHSNNLNFLYTIFQLYYLVQIQLTHNFTNGKVSGHYLVTCFKINHCMKISHCFYCLLFEIVTYLIDLIWGFGY